MTAQVSQREMKDVKGHEAGSLTRQKEDCPTWVNGMNKRTTRHAPGPVPRVHQRRHRMRVVVRLSMNVTGARQSRMLQGETLTYLCLRRVNGGKSSSCNSRFGGVWFLVGGVEPSEMPEELAVDGRTSVGSMWIVSTLF